MCLVKGVELTFTNEFKEELNQKRANEHLTQTLIYIYNGTRFGEEYCALLWDSIYIRYTMRKRIFG
jgi:hypothetical protein